jgi:hypothetical protein
MTTRKRFKTPPGFKSPICDKQMKHGPNPDLFFPKGNQLALAENLTPESNKKRLNALFGAWATNVKKAEEGPFVTKNQIRKREKRKRLKLYETVAREQREIQELARKGAKAVMERLQLIAEQSPNETAAISAGLVILDRGYGKATQTNVNATLDANGKATDISGKELDARIQKVVERLEGITGRAPKAPKSEDKSVDLRKLDRDPNSTPLN